MGILEAWMIWGKVRLRLPQKGGRMWVGKGEGWGEIHSTEIWAKVKFNSTDFYWVFWQATFGLIDLKSIGTNAG
jgi:hypothetical protein